MSNPNQIVLLDFLSARVGNLAERLRMQGYSVVVARDPAEGAHLSLAEPPAAVVADLWMKGISGVQLCRLLKAEPATEHVPVILRGPDSARNRFWAERAGAAAYVVSGRMGDLARALSQKIDLEHPADDFFTAFPRGDDIHERIAAHLDAALFESVIASEVRALGTCGAFNRLFDLLSQFTSRVISYRWMALRTDAPGRLGLHVNPDARGAAEREARAALEAPDDMEVIAVEDEDATADAGGPPVIVRKIELGAMTIGSLALAPRHGDPQENARFASVIARELAGPIRMATLVEESQRMATIDVLTGLANRRAFSAGIEQDVARSRRHGHKLSVLLFDVDHFKAVNDKLGHATGDLVLAAIGRHVRETSRPSDWVGRWGGEEFIISLNELDEAGGAAVGERVRAGIEALEIVDGAGRRVPVTVSVGVATLEPSDTISTLVERADQAMYAAKANGRNRVEVASQLGNAAAVAPMRLVVRRENV